MVTVTEPLKGSEACAKHLKSAAHHYEKAAAHFREAAKREAKGHDHSADHEILVGSAHAVRARIDADEAVKHLVADLAAGEIS
jgi:hypothetical protein